MKKSLMCILAGMLMCAPSFGGDGSKFEKYLSQCRLDKAEETCRKASGPQQQQMYEQLADRYFFDGFWGKDEAWLNKSRDIYRLLGKTDAEIEADFAWRFFTHGDFERSMAYYQHKQDADSVNLCKIGILSRRYGRLMVDEVFVPTMVEAITPDQATAKLGEIARTTAKLHPKLLILSLMSARNILKQHAYDYLYSGLHNPHLILATGTEEILTGYLTALNDAESEWREKMEQMERELGSMIQQINQSDEKDGGKS